MPRPGTGSPPCWAEPHLCLPNIVGFQASPRVPPMDAQGCCVPAQRGQQCLLSAMCHLLPTPFHHLSSPTVSSFQLCAISHLHLLHVLHPIMCYLPSCAISHHLPPLAGCHLPSCTISYNLSSPIPSVSHHVPFPTLFHCLPCHQLHLLRTSSGHTHYPTSCPKPYWFGNASGKKAANPKQCTKACSSPLEFPV